MTAAMGLLVAAMQLLAIVSANPSLPQDFRDFATQTANNAITYAQAEIAKQPVLSTPAPTPSVSQPTPVIIGAMTEPSKAEMIVSLYTHVDDEYTYKVWTKDTQGEYTRNPVTLGNETKTPNTITTKELGDWNTAFTIRPEKGTHQLTFKSGELSKTIELVVE